MIGYDVYILVKLNPATNTLEFIDLYKKDQIDTISIPQNSEYFLIPAILLKR